jgi:hypothetical protein
MCGMYMHTYMYMHIYIYIYKIYTYSVLGMIVCMYVCIVTRDDSIVCLYACIVFVHMWSLSWYTRIYIYTCIHIYNSGSSSLSSHRCLKATWSLHGHSQRLIYKAAHLVKTAYLSRGCPCRYYVPASSCAWWFRCCLACVSLRRGLSHLLWTGMRVFMCMYICIFRLHYCLACVSLQRGLSRRLLTGMTLYACMCVCVCVCAYR